ncbi:MAG TPA: acyl-CoA dehydrogenase family protein, partial [Dehalococcoidia bacterium]
MQVAEIPSLSDEINDIRQRTARIVDGAIIPAEPRLREPGPERTSLYRELQQQVKGEGLWAPHLPAEYGGMGIGFLGHAYMNEVLAWSPYSGGIFG